MSQPRKTQSTTKPTASATITPSTRPWIYKIIDRKHLPTKVYLKGSTAALTHDESIIVRDITNTSTLKKSQTYKTLYLKCFPNYQTSLPTPTECSFLGCTDPFEHGAHVRFEFNGKYYVVPSCQEHNKPRSTERHGLKPNVLAIKQKRLN